jgi:predicted metal-dependent hydrolase
MAQAPLPRLVPDEPLPPYTFVPGRTPHPVSDPAGHQFGIPPAPPAPLDPERWHDSRAFLHGIDLFNHGYYWEAHEAWEGLWHACGRRGPVGDLLKGLIRLAAAGVKAREGRPRGVADHAAAAARLFGRVAAALGAPSARILGLSPADLDGCAREATTLAGTSFPADGVHRVFGFVLQPSDERAS